MDSDRTEDTSSNYSTESSDDDGMETAEIHATKLQLPQGLCDRKDVFLHIFSLDTWNSLSDETKQHLQTFLPNFPENDEVEKNKTLEKLFNCEEFKFNSPLERFHNDLKAGYYRPDIARMRRFIKKAERRESNYRYRCYRQKLKHEIVESQKRCLNQFYDLPPGVEPKLDKMTKVQVDLITHRTKRRYCQILASIQAQVGDNFYSGDETYPEGPPISLSRKQRRHLNSIKNNFTTSFNNNNNSNKSIIQPILMRHANLDLEKYITPLRNPFYITDDNYKNLLVHHKRRKLQNPDDPELNTKGITLTDIVYKTQLPYVKNLPNNTLNKHHLDNNNKIINKKKIKKESTFNTQLPESFSKNNNCLLGRNSSNSENESDSDSFIDTASLNNKNKIKTNRTIKSTTPIRVPTSKIKTEIKNETLELFTSPELENDNNNLIKPVNNFTQYNKLTFSDLEGIDMMNIPIDLDNSDIDILGINNKPELMQETHSNFLSLIRDIICSTNEHRMNMIALEERLKSWQENPISPLNDWYSLTDNWINLLKSALNFLCGNSSEQPDDFVPYMEYKLSLDMYQWIGAGRDSDNLLSPLCQYWLEHRSEAKVFSLKDKEEIDIEFSDRSQTPPPPRCPTNWTVRKATIEEIKEFREQERRRYNNPHKAFTYRCNGYESVVGPLKGIYNPAVGNTKARGHTMLSADRPNFVTILSLVRDATARLPNGEGTRTDICELLKSSQYISSTAPDNVLQSVVSGALDRMHTQFDPCVKYDPKRKIWIYLHRNRTEEDFERIHQQYQGINKNKKSNKKSTSKSKLKSEKNSKPIKNEIVQSTVGGDKGKIVNKNKVIPIPTTTTTLPNLVAHNPTKPTSLLLSNNILQKQETSQQILDKSLISSSSTSSKIHLQDEKDINDTLQGIVQSRVGSPITTKQIQKGKSLVKIITPPSGKSLIIPSNNQQIVKQVQEQRNTSNKQLNQQISQQLLQMAQQKQTIQIIQKPTNENTEKLIEQKNKVPVTIQQQYIQSITQQQLQNIKNVTLVRNFNQNQNVALTPVVSSSPSSTSIDISKSNTVQDQVQIKTQAPLAPALIQTIKQKILPHATQQPIILKQKTVAQIQKQNSNSSVGGTSILGQSKLATTVNDGNKTTITTAQNPVVAKVLTNAAGQVISVESLLAHQKQHGSLPQGTTLRVSGTKGAQANIIQLTGTTKQNTLAQFAVASQNNIIALTSQPKLVVASQTTSLTTTTTTGATTVSRTINKTQNITKFTPKVAQQLINAKLITQNVDGQKLVQPKIFVGQQNQVKLANCKSVSKPVTLSVAANANTIRMVNAANLNLTHISGKPVLLASKGNTIQNIQGQNVILQTQPNTSGTPIILQNAAKTIPSTNISHQQTSSNNINIINQQNVVLGPQIKMQSTQAVFSGGGVKSASSINQQSISQGHIVLGGHPVRLQTTSASNTQRVVVASQGQGGQIVAQQILLPAGFQGTAINIKALQGVKVIPIAQAFGQGKGVQGRPVFARVMNPTIRKTTPASNTTNEKITDPTTTSTD